MVHLSGGKARSHSIQAIRIRKTQAVFSDQIHRVFCPVFVLFVVDLQPHESYRKKSKRTNEATVRN